MDQSGPYFLLIAIFTGIVAFFLAVLAGLLGWYIYLTNRRTEAVEKHLHSLVDIQTKAAATLKRQEQIVHQQLDTQLDQIANDMAAAAEFQHTLDGPETLWICKDYEDIGDLTIPTVEAMLTDGQLSKDDFYYDWEKQEWVPLGSIAA